MQSVDYTTLVAANSEITNSWIPARIEQVYQRDRYTLFLLLRTMTQKGWLTICWHPQAARVCLGNPPPRTPDTFTFSDQLRHQIKGLALTASELIAPWERVIDLQFARRPGENPLWHIYVEIMGKYSNVILTDADRQVITAAHQVSSHQSRLRPIQTGQAYQLPPPLVGTLPKLEESFTHWQERVSLIPGGLKRQLLNSYQGLSPSVAVEIIEAAKLNPEKSTEELSLADWQSLFKYWQEWLNILKTKNFRSGWQTKGYTVLGWNSTQLVTSVQELLDSYYTREFNRQIFKQLQHQLMQKVNNLLKKIAQKAETFQQRLEQSTEAEAYRQQADLLMAHLPELKPGMTSITLSDFETGKPIKIKLNPEKNGVQNAQFLYKTHQKLKRAKDAVKPLLKEANLEINYLEQVRASLSQLETYEQSEDLEALEEIREELIQQNYLKSDRSTQTKTDSDSKPYCYKSPSGFELWIGRNNRQNDRLTFRTAGDYDLWFHTQEIPGSHLLLRLEPGAIPDTQDLQFSADFAAYYSQARQSDLVPVIYTEPKNVYKPKGAKPGMAIYKKERVIWGRPQLAKQHIYNA